MLTPQGTLRDGLLVVLGRRGGALSRFEALNLLEQLIGDSLTNEDRQTVKSRNEEKWRNRASFERAGMVREGLLTRRNDGIWELDTVGWELFRSIEGLGRGGRDSTRA